MPSKKKQAFAVNNLEKHLEYKATLSFGEMMTYCRKIRRWKQTDVAKKLGVTQKSVSFYETERTVPLLTIRLAIEKLFENIVTVKEIEVDAKKVEREKFDFSKLYKKK